MKLPDEVTSLLKDIDSFAKRERTVTFAAAGVLRRGQSSFVAEPLLEIVLGAAGLPTQYGPARFAMWLQEEDLWEPFSRRHSEHGQSAGEVGRNLFVSSAIREALLEVNPGWAASAADAGQAIRRQLPIRDVSDDMVIDALRQVLEGVARRSEYGEKATMLLTLLVLDELQQYVEDDVQLLLEVQEHH